MSSPPHFSTAVDAILKNWTALQLAISQGSGGAHSAAVGAWLVEALVQWFGENHNLESYEVAEFLEDVLNKELNLIIEDGSVDEVGTMIVDFYSICSTKPEAEVIEKLRKLPKCDLSTCRSAENDDDDEEDDENRQNVEKSIGDMEIDEEPEKRNRQPKSNVVVDEDGWSTVVSRKKK